MAGERLGTIDQKVYQKLRFFSKSWFIALLKGERKLWEAYWVLGICLAIPAFLIELLSNSSGNIIALTSVLLIFLAIVILFIQVIWAIAVWKCAQNVDNRIFYYLARIIVVVSVLKSVTEIIS